MVLVEKVFTVTPDAEITKMVAALSLDSCDTLMKNVYKLMGKCKACSAMLKVHAQLVEKAGVGSIVRAITDRIM